MKRIYLDNAATTPLDKRVAAAMRDFELEYFGNPSSTHREGQNARAKIDFARESISKFFNARPQEIIFTSGATEANNLAIQGMVGSAIKEWKMRPHIITTKLEHQSVYNVVKNLQEREVVDATFLEPNADGMIEAEQITKAITDHTVLVSAIFVSNEIGSILPVREISKMIVEVNKRQRHQIVFHVDAVQAVKFYNCNVEKLGCDLLTASAHKIFGPKGTGMLYIKTGTKLENLTFGGSQEYGKRPGTQNTTGIIGFEKAIELLGTLEERTANASKVALFRDQLIDGLQNIAEVELNGPKGELRSAENVSFTIYGIDQDALMTALDLAGIAASTGSACVSGSSKPSHVIEALNKAKNRDQTRQAATIRFTLSKYTTKTEIDNVVEILPEIIAKLR